MLLETKDKTISESFYYKDCGITDDLWFIPDDLWFVPDKCDTVKLEEFYPDLFVFNDFLLKVFFEYLLVVLFDYLAVLILLGLSLSPLVEVRNLNFADSAS